MRLGVIADDLTGALDTGVQFVQAGLDTYMGLEWGALFQRLDAGEALPDVAVVNTRTRGLSGMMARYDVIQQTLLVLVALEQADRLFVKIDSTLRGPWRGAVEAAASQCRRVIVCPAFPAQGRIVQGEAVYLQDGTQIGRVRIPSDPVSCNWIVPDATSDADLDSVVATYWDDPEILFCGSAGLAGAIARRLSHEAPVAARWEPARRVAVVIGSRTKLARAQVAALGEAELAGEHVMLFIAPHADGEEDPGIARELARLLAEEHERRAFDGLVLSGGETADQVLTHLRTETVELAAELLPGCPLGVLRGGSVDGARVVTKSGSFGERDTLVRLVRMLQGGSA